MFECVLDVIVDVATLSECCNFSRSHGPPWERTTPTLRVLVNESFRPTGTACDYSG